MSRALELVDLIKVLPWPVFLEKTEGFNPSPLLANVQINPDHRPAIVEDKTAPVDWYLRDRATADPQVANTIALYNHRLYFDRYRAQHGRLFEVTRVTNQLLLDLAIDARMPVSALVLPFDDLYFHFEPGPEDCRFLHSFSTGPARVQGAFLSAFQFRPTTLEEGLDWDALGLHALQNNPCLELGVVWRAIDKPADIPFITTVIVPLTRPDAPLHEALRCVPRYPNTALDAFGDTLTLHFAKLLLYMASDGVAFEEVREHSELTRRIARTAPKKRAKLERRLLRSSDRIVVRPRPLPEGERYASAPTRGEKSPHWRRRHVRLVRCGAGLSQVKMTTIAPTLVRKDKLGQAPVPDKPYTLKT